MTNKYDEIVHSMSGDTDRLVLMDSPTYAKQNAFSEVMAHRDNFFHSCWMRLKQKRHDLHGEMALCELYIAGLVESAEEKKDDDDAETDTIL